MPPTKVILLACGSFNPPTNMHLRMFEIARDYLHRVGNYVVIGGLVSPVHDGYAKKDLVSSTHRLAMIKLALENSDWIKLSEWECKQESWSRTRITLQHHQNLINSVLNNSDIEDVDLEVVEWISQNIKNGCIGNVQVKLLCGSDLLESFGTPGLWADEDIDTIVGQHGLVVVTREGTNPLRFIYESDVLTRYMGNINIVTEWITNEISSTKIRRALRRNESVKYLIPDRVIEHIHRNNLFGSKNKETKYIQLITSSPVDIIMDSPSPPSNNCANICNNNLFPNSSTPLSKPYLAINNEDTFNKLNNSFRHPGQAVKIVSDSTAHKYITNEVGKNSLGDTNGDIVSSKIQAQRSHIEYVFIERRTKAKSDIEFFV